MRLTDLLESRLVDGEGVDLGRIRDVWLVQDGPPIGPFGAALRVERVVAGSTAIGSRLGYERASMTGPGPLAAFFHSLKASLAALRTSGRLSAFAHSTIRVNRRGM